MHLLGLMLIKNHLVRKEIKKTEEEEKAKKRQEKLPAGLEYC
jgi:hypothetical protein